MRAKARQLCEVELRYLLRVGKAARADDLTAVFAILLLDMRALREAILRQGRRLADPLTRGLHELKVGGYDALADVVESWGDAENGH
jgi:hypothetical protein